MNIEIFASKYPNQIDLTDATQSALVRQAVDEILVHSSSLEDLLVAEDNLLVSKQNIFLSLAIKMAISKRLLKTVEKGFQLSVVFAMYKEHERILTSQEHPHGEDFLRRKHAQMEWLFSDRPDVDWQIIAVDDGCPDQSGSIAQKIVESNGLQERIKVLWLQDGIDKKESICQSMLSTNDSRKGGSIIYGMWKAIQNEGEDQFVIFTDADLSTHLGQSMILLEPLLNQGKEVSIGSRRETNSVVVKQGSRNDRGKMFIYLWKRMLPPLSDIIDTQCGFKAFTKAALTNVLDDMIETQFAFDIELLLKAELWKTNCIQKNGIAWIDSEAASTTTDLQPYLGMLKSISKMYKKYLPQNASTDEYANFIDQLSDAEFQTLLNNIPEDITSREPIEFSSFDQVKIEHFQLALGS